MVMGLVSRLSLVNHLTQSPSWWCTPCSNKMDAREKDSGRCRTWGVCFWPFLNSSGWWWLISSVFLTRTSCHKTTHANGYYGAWPGCMVSVRVLPLTKICTWFSLDFALSLYLEEDINLITFKSTTSFSLLVLTTLITTWFYSQHLSLLDTFMFIMCSSYQNITSFKAETFSGVNDKQSKDHIHLYRYPHNKHTLERSIQLFGNKV